MSDLFVFDIYTVTVFGVIVASCSMLALILLLARTYPRQVGAIGKLAVPVMFLLMLSFCSLQVAQLERNKAKYSDSRDQKS